MNGAVIGDNCLIGAGALVTQGMEIPEGSLVFGSPAKVKRRLTPEEIRVIHDNAEDYVQLAKNGKEGKYDG
jgi:carbonic anhydrase/acetyltransferase-like protein (isoleucine patch superfamily)